MNRAGPKIPQAVGKARRHRGFPYHGWGICRSTVRPRFAGRVPRFRCRTGVPRAVPHTCSLILAVGARNYCWHMFSARCTPRSRPTTRLADIQTTVVSICCRFVATPRTPPQSDPLVLFSTSTPRSSSLYARYWLIWSNVHTYNFLFPAFPQSASCTSSGQLTASVPTARETHLDMTEPSRWKGFEPRPDVLASLRPSGLIQTPTRRTRRSPSFATE